MLYGSARWRHFKEDWWRYLVLIFMAIITFYPFIFMVITSFKDNYQFMHNFFGITFPFHWTNYLDAWKAALSQYMFNSIIVTTVSLFGTLAVASLGAYAFARFDFPGKDFLFMTILALLMVPGILTLIPAYMLVKSLGLLDSRLVLILPYISGQQVFAIFILRSFFASLPEELFEAARIDGASEFYGFFRIALPLTKPTLVSVGVVNVLFTWNDYLWPLVTLSNDKLWTVTIGLVSFQSQYSGLELWGPLFAGYTIVSLPLILLFTFFMRYFIAGLTSGALKV
jgi:ABC-type glycerol-3-phosphate transport system permease component